MFNAMRKFAYRTLTDKSFAYKVLAVEAAAVLGMGFFVHFLEGINNPAAGFLKIACFVVMGLLAMDVLIAVLVVGKLK